MPPRTWGFGIGVATAADVGFRRAWMEGVGGRGQTDWGGSGPFVKVQFRS